MISDVLAEAIPQITHYLNHTPLYSDQPEGAMVRELLDHMRAVLKALDTAPGTNRETADQNNA